MPMIILLHWVCYVLHCWLIIYLTNLSLRVPWYERFTLGCNTSCPGFTKISVFVYKNIAVLKVSRYACGVVFIPICTVQLLYIALSARELVMFPVCSCMCLLPKPINILYKGGGIWKYLSDLFTRIWYIIWVILSVVDSNHKFLINWFSFPLFHKEFTAVPLQCCQVFTKAFR